MSIFRQSERLGLGAATCRVCPAVAVPGSPFCERHQGEAGRLLLQPQRAGYRSAAYRKARRAAIRRANGRCEVCREPLPRIGHHRRIECQTHHVDGDPMNNDPRNLLVCCLRCHSGSRRPS